jgi:hypothetical protein
VENWAEIRRLHRSEHIRIKEIARVCRHAHLNNPVSLQSIDFAQSALEPVEFSPTLIATRALAPSSRPHEIIQSHS